MPFPIRAGSKDPRKSWKEFIDLPVDIGRESADLLAFNCSVNPLCLARIPLPKTLRSTRFLNVSSAGFSSNLRLNSENTSKV